VIPWDCQDRRVGRFRQVPTDCDDSPTLALWSASVGDLGGLTVGSRHRHLLEEPCGTTHVSFGRVEWRP
jgi:hypothetical protein